MISQNLKVALGVVVGLGVGALVATNLNPSDLQGSFSTTRGCNQDMLDSAVAEIKEFVDNDLNHNYEDSRMQYFWEDLQEFISDEVSS